MRLQRQVWYNGEHLIDCDVKQKDFFLVRTAFSTSIYFKRGFKLND